MTVKLFCALTIILSCSFIGMRLSNALFLRVRTLSGMLGAINKMGNQISAVRMPLNEIYDELSKEKGAVGEFFSKVKTGQNWKKQLDILPGITSTDKRIFIGLSENLGEFEVERQLGQIKLTEELVASALKQAKTDMAERAKVYRAMSFFTGVVIAVLLI